MKTTRENLVKIPTEIMVEKIEESNTEINDLKMWQFGGLLG